jgi:hypothetical protein
MIRDYEEESDEAQVGARQAEMLYCNIVTHHHHHGGEAHPSPTFSPSLLRLSAPRRMAVAGFLIALMWALAAWAMH